MESTSGSLEPEKSHVLDFLEFVQQRASQLFAGALLFTLRLRISVQDLGNVPICVRQLSQVTWETRLVIQTLM
jgi:hypothetical protein